MIYNFSDIKATQAAALILNQFGLDREMDSDTVKKLLYLADSMFLVITGQPITGSLFYCGANGPGLVNIEDIISKKEYSKYWNQHIISNDNNLVLIKDPGNDELSQFETEIVISSNLHLRDWDYLPERPFPIIEDQALEFVDVLCAYGWSNKDIEELEEFNQYQNSVNDMLTRKD